MSRKTCTGYLTLLGFLLLPFSSSFAQTSIRGTVTDKEGEPIPGANVYLEDTYDGATTDSAGVFQFDTYEEGQFTMVISFIGFKNYEDSFLLDGTPLELNIALREEFNELNAVVISAGAFEASDEGKAVVFKPLDIVTTAGSNGDIYGALGTLPGAAQIGNDEGLFVRGGANYETTTIIDGMVVQNPFFSQVPDVPNRGRFSPFQFKGTVFSTGGYSAQYGQALSSAIILNSQDLATQTSSGLSLSPIFAGGFHQRAYDKTSFSVSLDYFNVYLYNLIVPQRQEYRKAPQGLSGNITLAHKTSQTGILKLQATYSSNTLGIDFPGPNDTLQGFPFDLNNNNVYINSTWREILGKKWTILVGASYSYNDDKILISDLDNSRGDSRTQGKITMTNQLTDKIKLRFGGESHYLQATNTFTSLAPDGSLTTELDERYNALFLESEIYITNDLAGRVGLRGEHSSSLGEYNLAPRLSLAYKTGEFSQLSAAYGQFFQTPGVFFLSTAAPDLNYERADHYILSWQWMTKNRTLRVEGYYKDYPKLVLLQDDGRFGIDGSGYAGGGEVFYRDRATINNGDFWISYSYVNTQRQFQDYPEQVQPTFAATHLASMVYKHYIGPLRSQIGGTFTYQSGRPFHDPRSMEFLDGQTPDFSNLSLNWSYLTEIGGNFTVIFASFGNILGRKNVFGYRYFDPMGQPLQNYQYGLDQSEFVEFAERPPADRTYFAGMFISFQHVKKVKQKIPEGASAY